MATNPKKLIEFTNKLANDDDFRAKVSANPSAAGAAYGVALDPTKTGQFELASKEDVAATIEENVAKAHVVSLGEWFFAPGNH